MNLSRPFILRPVATSLLMLAILLTGILAARLLPISALPQVDYPSIQVVTLYPGASAEVMTSSVTAPLERQFGQMPGLEQMSSTSSGGASVIILRFGLDVRLDVAEQDVQAAINAAANLLPNDLPMPPLYHKINPADAPILTLGISSADWPLWRVQDLIETRVAQKISQIPGVGLVSLAGGQRPAVRVRADPAALAALGLTLAEVRSALADANVNRAKGSFDGPEQASTLDANDQLRSADEYRRQIIAFKQGAPIRLGDVAEVLDGVENSRLAAWANHQAAVVLNIQRQPGANLIATLDRVQALLPQLRAALPPSLEIIPLSDRSLTIRASIRDTGGELLLSVLLVVLVMFLFLRSPSATLIPALAVPLSLVGTLGVIYLAGFSINNLTLMALTVATGFVVDDAIVVVENIARHLEAGGTPRQAALRGARQIGFTILSLTISLVAVLIPLLFMGDVVGRLFREFAITLAVAILISALVSLTLTPMLCAKLLRPIAEQRQGTWKRLSGRAIEGLIRAYGVALGRVLDHQPLTLALAVGLLGLTLALYLAIPKGFFPVQDTGLIQGIAEADQSVSFRALAERQQALIETLLAVPEVESLASFAGVDGTNPAPNTGRLLIRLTPHHQRQVSAAGLIQRIGPELASLPGMRVYLQPVQDLAIEDRLTRTQFQLVLDSPRAEDLGDWVPRILDRLQARPELRDLASDLQDQGLQAYLDIDRASAGRLGVSVAALDAALYDAFGQRQISTIFTQSSQYRVILEAGPGLAAGLGALEGIYVAGAEGPVRLASLVQVSERAAPLTINRLGQFPAATLSFNLAPGVALGQAVAAIDQELAELAPPASLRANYQGAALAFQASLANSLWLILAAVITVYIVLGVLYESFIHPVTILSTLPSAAVGALLALRLGDQDLGIIAIIGILLLIGIVKKNAILMIDFALEAQRRDQRPPREAIQQAALLRFRPILMTTLAALLGALPLMLGAGTGSELRHPLGISLVGGLIASQLLTLFTTPVVYLAFERLRGPASQAPGSGASSARP